MFLTELPQLRTEDSTAIAGYGRKLGWTSRGRMAEGPYEQLAADVSGKERARNGNHH
jgi:hypothetical protein